MSTIRSLATLAISSAALLLFACNSGGDKKAETPTGDTATHQPETSPSTAPTPSGPKSAMLIIHHVADYNKWKAAYDGHDSVRLANGLHNYVICRGTEDSNQVLVSLIMDDVTKAKAMGNSAELKDRMKKAGVTGAPMIDYIEALTNDTTHIQSSIRVMVRHKVKDFDAWKKEFDSHQQARMDAGLTDRVLARTVDDHNSVTLVFAVSDLAKAKAFMNSQDLKDKMKAAGVEGAPWVFFYRVVQKY